MIFCAKIYEINDWEENELITVETDLGTIKVANSVIGNIIKDVIDSFDGKVIISNSKGKIPNQLTKLGSKEEYSDVVIELTEEGLLNITVYVILKFGTSIKATTEKLIADIRSSIKETIAMDVNEVDITVTGMMSKHIAPRHIEVRG